MNKPFLLVTLLLTFLLIANQSMAQAPSGFSYQSVIRDSNNDLVVSAPVGIQISLLQGSISGASVYTETHAVNTNANGLITLQIGSGTVVAGTFNTIDWSAGPYFIKADADPSGGTSYTISGTQQLLSVPYALYAATSGSGSSSNLVAGNNITISNDTISTTNTSPFELNAYTVRLDTSVADMDSTDFVFGSPQLDDDGNPNHDNRMFFDKSKGAFRVGRAPQDQWDESNLGDFSIGMGDRASATGENSVAIGVGSSATGNSSIALGTGTSSSGLGSVAIVGGNAQGPLSVAVGSNVTSRSYNEIAMGSSSTSYNPNSTSTWNLNDRLFSIGNGYTDPNPPFENIYSNALTILKNGNTGLGTDVPSATLDVEGTVQYVDGNQADGYVLTSDANGNATWQEVSSSNSSISDADNDTKIQVEEGPDDDIIRFDLSGTEFMRLDSGRIEITNTGQSIFLGEAAGANDDYSDNQNIFIGDSTGFSSSNGTRNTFLGYRAGHLFTSGTGNVFSGYQAGSSQTNGSYNVFLGFEAGSASERGNQNIFIGNRAGYNNEIGGSNVFLGATAGLSNTVGNNNVFLGQSSGLQNIGGYNNSFLGTYSGLQNTTGESNVYLGYSSGFNNVSGSGNVFLGVNSGYNETGSNKLYIENTNTASPLVYGEFDNDLLRVNGTLNINSAYSFPTADGTSGQVLTTDGSGDATWQEIDTGSDDQTLSISGDTLFIEDGNSVVLPSTMEGILEDSDNDTKIQVEESTDEDQIRFDLEGTEHLVMRRNADGKLMIEVPNNRRNLFLGSNAGANDATFPLGRNTFIGEQTGRENITGTWNTYLGDVAGASNVSGEGNVAVGASSGASNTSGNDNIYIGRKSGISNLGSSNVMLGQQAGYNNVNGSGNIFLGNNAGYNELDSNRLYIENSASANPLIYGEFDNDLLRVNGTLNINNAYSFPTADGTSGQVLTTDGSGNANWQAVSSSNSSISDTDNDTKIQVEETADEDAIRFDVAGTERLVIEENASGGTMLHLPNNSDNIFFGTEAGQATTSGIGPNGKSNNFIGYQAGYSNTLGYGNVFSGYQAGYSNSAFYNLAIGYRAGYLNTSGYRNIFIGANAGYNETGSNKLYIENTNTASPLVYGEFDNDLLRVNGTLNVNNAYSFPTADGTSGQVLTTDGSGDATWQEIDTGSDDQTLSVSGDTLFIEDGNSIVLPNTFASQGLTTDQQPCDTTGTLDASNEPSSFTSSPFNNQFWQEVIPTSTGLLTGIELYFLSSFGGTLTVYDGQGTSGNILTTVIVGSTGSGWQRIDIVDPVLITVGNSFTFHLTSTNVRIPNTPNGTYAGASSWGSDVFFRTYINSCDDTPAYVISPPTTDGTINLANVDTVFFSDNTYQLTAATDDQTLSISGDTLFIEDGNSVVLPLNSSIADADNDTKIQVEEGPDEDIIRFDLAGTEFMRLDSGRIEITNTGQSIFLGEGAGVNDDYVDNQNVFIGDSAGYANTFGRQNVFSGYRAGYSNIGGNRNVFSGYKAGVSSVGGVGNVFLGAETGLANTFGVYNVFLGDGAGIANTNGSQNSFMGVEAGKSNTSGNSNIFLGPNSGNNNETGSFNIYIGRASGAANTTGNFNVFLGFEAGSNETGSNKLYIDNTRTSSPLIYGEFDNDLLRVNGTLNIDSAYSFPTTDGTANQVLQTDGSGNVTWGDGIDNQTIDAFSIVNDTLQLSLEDDGQAVQKVSLSAYRIPVGSVQMFAGQTAPDGWLFCDGSSFSEATYPELQALLSSTNTPNLQGRFPIGRKPIANPGDNTYNLGSTGGQERVTLTVDQMPEHNHGSGTLQTQYPYKTTSNTGTPSSRDGADVRFYDSQSITGSTADAGLGEAHNNIPPYYVVNFIIKAN